MRAAPVATDGVEHSQWSSTRSSLCRSEPGHAHCLGASTTSARNDSPLGWEMITIAEKTCKARRLILHIGRVRVGRHAGALHVNRRCLPTVTEPFDCAIVAVTARNDDDSTPLHVVLSSGRLPALRGSTIGQSALDLDDTRAASAAWFAAELTANNKGSSPASSSASIGLRRGGCLGNLGRTSRAVARGRILACAPGASLIPLPKAAIVIVVVASVPQLTRLAQQRWAIVQIFCQPDLNVNAIPNHTVGHFLLGTSPHV